MAQTATGSSSDRTTSTPVPSIYPASTDESVHAPLGTAPRVPPDLPAWLEIDLGAVRRNAERLQQAARAPLVAMVKADGYGLGAVPVARALERMGETLWGFGVSSLREADELRAAGITARILCATPLLPTQFSDAARLDVRPALHRGDDIERWSECGLPWHLSIDTGMSRAGVRWDEVAALSAAIDAHPPEGVFTHFHSAELNNGSREEQESRFESALAALRSHLTQPVLVHCDNSAGICARQGSSDGPRRALARAGIGLYGATVVKPLGLEQPVSLRARVLDLRTVHAGETVSYDATWLARTPRRIATIGVGHGDGYRRALSNRGIGLLRGGPVAVVGIVTMDMTMLDVTDVPCELGDIVTLLGDETDYLSIDDVADTGELSPYELLVGLRLRLPRLYYESHEGSRRGN
jgi:alanine racemase